jgi:hypothetical protein
LRFSQPKPGAFGRSSSTIRSSSSALIASTVSSVQPSATTMTSTASRVCRSALSIASSTWARRLCVGMTTEIDLRTAPIQPQ